MKKLFTFLLLLTSVEVVSKPKPMGCRQGEDFFLINPKISCTRNTCSNPAVMAACFRTYTPPKRGTRFQEANPHCVEAFCRTFSEEPGEDKRGNPLETYRDRYEEIEMRDEHMPSFEMVKDLYNLLCSGEGYNSEAARNIFEKVRVEHLHTLETIKLQQKAMRPQGPSIRDYGLMGYFNAPPQPTVHSMKDFRDVCQIVFGSNQFNDNSNGYGDQNGDFMQNDMGVMNNGYDPNGGYDPMGGMNNGYDPNGGYNPMGGGYGNQWS